MKKQLLLLVMMLLPIIAMADDSGSCGNNVTWSYEEATHTLTISGTSSSLTGTITLDDGANVKATIAKGGTLNDRRIVISRMNHKEAVIKLFDEVAPRFKERPGGYTRIVRTRTRLGDASPMAVIALVD